MDKIKILVAPNAFKGSMSPWEATEKIAEGMEVSKWLQVDRFPIADGGDGTLEVIINYFNGKYMTTEVPDPLGRKIDATWGVIDNHTAVIEMANASGVKLLKVDELNPLQTNTVGTGELIRKAIEYGCDKIILCIGGSATVDGGSGILKAFGAEFFDAQGNEIAGGNYLVNLAGIDLKDSLAELRKISFTILSDVDNPLLGERGAARVYGPQKGADAGKVEQLEVAMKLFSELIADEAKEDFSQMHGAGAAGGIAFMLKSLVGAEVCRGFDFLVGETDLLHRIEACDIVITGEGKIDLQTLEGKGAGRISSLAKRYRKFCIGMCGVYEWHKEMDDGFDLLIPINGGEPFNEQMLNKNPENLRRAAMQLSKLITAVLDRRLPR